MISKNGVLIVMAIPTMIAMAITWAVMPSTESKSKYYQKKYATKPSYRVTPGQTDEQLLEALGYKQSKPEDK